MKTLSLLAFLFSSLTFAQDKIGILCAVKMNNSFLSLEASTYKARVSISSLVYRGTREIEQFRLDVTNPEEIILSAELRDDRNNEYWFEGRGPKEATAKTLKVAVNREKFEVKTSVCQQVVFEDPYTLKVAFPYPKVGVYRGDFTDQGLSFVVQKARYRASPL